MVESPRLFGKAVKGVTAFNMPKTARPMLPRVRPLERAQVEPSGPFFIGRQRASDLEWRVWRMLHRLGWRDEQISYQVDILGGRQPGGQVLDFVVDGGSVIYVIFVNGDYWHRYGPKYNETRMSEQQVTTVWPGARVVSLFNADLATDEIALQSLTRWVGRGV